MKVLPWIILCLACSAAGCRNQASEEGHAHGAGGHSHEEGLSALSYTLYAHQSELFVEFPPLVAGQTSRFAVHLTELRHFKPLLEGEVTVSLIKGQKGIRHRVTSPGSPGIFRPALQPREAGQYQLVFDVKTKAFTDRFVIDPVTVYPDAETALASQPEEAPGEEVTYLKEQAWKTDFATQVVQLAPFGEVIRASGQILPAPGQEMTVTAPGSGIVSLGSSPETNSPILVGSSVRKGEVLFTLSGGALTENNLQTRYRQARTDFEQAKADYERAGELVKDRLIPQREYQAALARYRNTQTVYENLSRNYRAGEQRVAAPQGGFLKNIAVREGQYVEAGQPLATLSGQEKLVLRVDVPQHYAATLSRLQGATFRTTYDTTLYRSEDLDGKLLSYGKAASEESVFLPVYFGLANRGNLLPGAFTEVYLRTREAEPALVIPASALVEESGYYYAYVQTSGEGFEKRSLQLGPSDGRQVAVRSGIRAGERVVTKGAYQIKLSTASGAVPAHGHEH